jgi:hypothetical protein
VRTLTNRKLNEDQVGGMESKLSRPGLGTLFDIVIPNPSFDSTIQFLTDRPLDGTIGDSGGATSGGIITRDTWSIYWELAACSAERRCKCGATWFDLPAPPDNLCPNKQPTTEKPKFFKRSKKGPCLELGEPEDEDDPPFNGPWTGCEFFECEKGFIYRCEWTGRWLLEKYYLKGCPGEASWEKK